MTQRFVHVYAPATISNVGPGFDILGIAIDNPGDRVTAEVREQPGLVFSLQGLHTTMPDDYQNVAAHVARLMLQTFNPPFGVALTLHKQMPIGSGLGSSGASAAAAAFAINALLPKPLSKADLIPFAMAGEQLASGSAHADNVAPALLGGMCLIRSYDPLDVIKIPVKNSLYWIVAHPHIVVLTQAARDLLPKTVPLSALVAQSSNLGGLLTGLITGDKILVAKSLQDVIIEPVRATLIPAFDQVKKAALQAGALAFSISGSGPSVFAVAATRAAAKKIATHIKKSFATEACIDCDIYISRINTEGTKLLDAAL